MNRVLSSMETLDLLADYLALFEVDMASGTINWASRTMERMFGYMVPGDLQGRRVEVLLPEPLRDRHATVHRPGFSENPSPRLMGRNLALQGQRMDGSVFPVEVMLLPRAANRQRVIVGLVFDLSERNPLGNPVGIGHG